MFDDGGKGNQMKNNKREMWDFDLIGGGRWRGKERNKKTEAKTIILNETKTERRKKRKR